MTSRPRLHAVAVAFVLLAVTGGLAAHTYASFQDTEKKHVSVSAGEWTVTTTTPAKTTTTTTATTTTRTDAAAISYVAFCVDGAKTGPGNDPCPDGTHLLVKFNWNGTAFVPEGGDAKGVSLTVIETKDGGEPLRVEWTSQQEIAYAAVVKSSTETCVFEYPDGATSGTVYSCDLASESEPTTSTPTG